MYTHKACPHLNFGDMMCILEYVFAQQEGVSAQPEGLAYMLTTAPHASLPGSLTTKLGSSCWGLGLPPGCASIFPAEGAPNSQVLQPRQAACAFQGRVERSTEKESRTPNWLREIKFLLGVCKKQQCIWLQRRISHWGIVGQCAWEAGSVRAVYTFQRVSLKNTILQIQS